MVADRHHTESPEPHDYTAQQLSSAAAQQRSPSNRPTRSTKVETNRPLSTPTAT
jgi:hypothetical protein